MKRIVTSTVVLVFVVFYSNLVQAQIEIGRDDLLGQIGSTQVFIEDERFSIAVDVGSPGENQVWDFRTTSIVDTLRARREFIAPDETPSASTFPQANLVEKISGFDADAEIYNFHQITTDYFINLGDSTRIFDPDTFLVFFQSDTAAPLPIRFDNTWLTAERDTTGFFPLSANISIDTTMNWVDGWGTLRLPLGDFECLRLRQVTKVINQTIVNGDVFSTQVDSFIQYNWLAKNAFQLARAQSQNGDTDPQFSDAQGFGILLESDGPATSVRTAGTPESFQLQQNYPNPFNPATTIRYRLEQADNVELTVFNTLGQTVRNLFAGFQAAGDHALNWDGRDAAGQRVSSGVYLYRLKTATGVQTRKMILMQ